tara:strand:+ start:943 stop:1167 length:225 start_codon:yes stop_codon:yes gene_type:complete
MDPTTRVTQTDTHRMQSFNCRATDNIFPLIVCITNDCRAVIERLWRSLKLEAFYLHELQVGLRANSGLARGFNP